ncbi:hypothetical protein PR202_ga18050 [Eleusine coracana subsp. coracana]|uniref:PIR2-like helical domain-containing protein n=1 Tax=Eleusine coracana subsp. coracana TaxID=191504 RepID=A0AAV5CSD9_ELECO|nr:hypothetical protein QOZ80_6AG0510050 [Eleusine coracana subsp. coracana]GJN00832.1 hypothetical protein PR202_ga18050 [Eleusine coracana subsp. coracana]
MRSRPFSPRSRSTSARSRATSGASPITSSASGCWTFTNTVVNSVLFPSWGTWTRPAGRDVVRRSLDGLIAFLTHLFPYLRRAEAVGYLDAANADPFVAAHLVIARCGMRRFGFDSAATVAAIRTALKCAAVAAGHPRPGDILVGWTVLSPGLISLPAPSNRPDANVVVLTSTLRILRKYNGSHYRFLHQLDAAEALVNRDLQLKDAWDLAKTRILNNNPGKEVPPEQGAMRRILLARIHGFYLQALAMLPTGELQERYHRSMLMGGHCYGPLDPVSNIIFNTVWHEQAFPASATTPAVQMISTKCLWRVAARSLYGMVSFLCTRYGRLTPELAVQLLQVAEADLQRADPYLFGKLDPDSCAAGFLQSLLVERERPPSSVEEAYGAAAVAAFHPDPSAQRVFLGSSDAVSKLKKGSETLQLQDGRVLSSMDIEIASEIVKSASSHQQQQEPEPEKLSKCKYSYRLEFRDRFWDHHQRVSDMVQAALTRFNKTVVSFFYY